MKREIEHVVLQSGIWAEDRQESHGFVLTPDVFLLSSSQHQQLVAIGAALGIVFQGLNRLMATAVAGLGSGKQWNLFRDVLTQDVPKRFQRLGVLRPQEKQQIIKVDFVERTDGVLQIVEIDAMNRRAMGYATLFRKIGEVVAPHAQRFPGIAPMLKQEVQRKGTNELLFLYGNIERFYEPEFLILAKELAAIGIKMTVQDEAQVTQSLDARLAINFPICDKQPKLMDWLEEQYVARRLGFLVPPKYFLGSKALLPLLRNDRCDPVLEAMLLSQIDAGALATLRQALPKSYLLRRDLPLPLFESSVLKRFVSSGMKGVIFSDDSSFNEQYRQALRQGTSILQEEVPLKRRLFRLFAPDGSVHVEERYTRIVVYFIDTKPAEAVVTACGSKRVHGAKEAINMGVVIEP